MEFVLTTAALNPCEINFTLSVLVFNRWDTSLLCSVDPWNTNCKVFMLSTA